MRKLHDCKTAEPQDYFVLQGSQINNKPLPHIAFKHSFIGGIHIPDIYDLHIGNDIIFSAVIVCY